MPPSPGLPLDLPEPDARDIAVSGELAARIRDACRAAGGSIGFDRYMELALYTPELGYYSSARSRFGPRGDFVTAPELSARFACCVARQVAQVLDHLGGGAVLEVGAGSGALAEGVLEGLDAAGHRDTPYLILERSAGARAFQAERLAVRGDRVRWLDDLPLQGFRGVVVANELLDAIPARCFQVAGGRVRELGVGTDGDDLEWTMMGDAVVEPDELATLLAGMDEGYRGELAPLRAAWVREAAARLEAGVLLLLDYGYPRRELYHPQRRHGTLACHYRHRVHDDPFRWPGLQDISVHVDFTAIAEAGMAAGLELAGYTTQAHFLMATGLLEGLDDETLEGPERARLTGQIQRLTLPGEMGEAVKVMALVRGMDVALAGFRGRDLTHRL